MDFSRDIFQAYNIQDIQNITVLKGAEASMYGSMGSNGVILIETDGATSDNFGYASQLLWTVWGELE